MIFDTMFPKNLSMDNYPTRRSDEFHLPLLRTLLAKNTFIYAGPKFRNTLNNDTKKPILQFIKEQIESFFFKSYNDAHSN